MKTTSTVSHSTAPVILVIDDDRQIVKYISALLELEGFRVHRAFDGVNGMAEYIKHKPHLIITDLVMPEKEGIELIADIRKQDPAIPIIAVSGGNRGFGEEYLLMARTLGASAILDKPFSPEMMISLVNKFISVVE